jgi:hypothetical protein
LSIEKRGYSLPCGNGSGMPGPYTNSGKACNRQIKMGDEYWQKPFNTAFNLKFMYAFIQIKPNQHIKFASSPTKASRR